MKLADFIANLEYLTDCLEDPVHNPLETGFRHSPLTTAEIIQRYREECYATRNSLLKLIEIIKKEGIE